MPRIGLIKLGCGTNLGKLTLGDSVWVSRGRLDTATQHSFAGVSTNSLGKLPKVALRPLWGGDKREYVDPHKVFASEAAVHRHEAERARDEAEWHDEQAAECDEGGAS